jgi:alkylation response protein AidB-like acyl-CoA dehydrogenase
MHIFPVSISSSELRARGAEVARFSAENAAEIDRTGSFPEKEFAKMMSAGLIVAPLARSLGGLGLGFESENIVDLLRLLRILGKGSLSVGRLYEGHVNGLQLIQTFAAPDQVEHFAHDARAQKIFGVWNAEAGDGLKFRPLGDNRYELIGSKTFCSGAGQVQRPLVGGTLPDGQHQLCVVPMEQVKTRIDSSWWTATGMRGSVSFKVDFSGVVLEDSWLIGNPNDYHREPWLTLGVIRFAAVQLGGAEGLVESTRSFFAKTGANHRPLPNCSPRTNGSGRGKRKTVARKRRRKSARLCSDLRRRCGRHKTSLPRINRLRQHGADSHRASSHGGDEER